MSQMSVSRSPSQVLLALHEAMNRHDLAAFLGCFDPGYRSEQPVHPDREFGGIEQVEKNWSAIFSGIPDFEAELISSATVGEMSWAEWRWTGTKADGSPLELRGVTLFGIQEGLIVWGRLYMEPVERAGRGIDAAVRGMTQGKNE